MNWEYYLEKGLVYKRSPDKNLSQSLIKTAQEDLNFLKSLSLSENSSRKIFSNYYDVLRSIVEAISVLEGYKIYSHEAFSLFLEKKGETLISKKFDRFRKIRNGINYYGKTISILESKENIQEICKIIKFLLKKYFKK
jgi:hypothetical protein